MFEELRQARAHDTSEASPEPARVSEEEQPGETDKLLVTERPFDPAGSPGGVIPVEADGIGASGAGKTARGPSLTGGLLVLNALVIVGAAVGLFLLRSGKLEALSGTPTDTPEQQLVTQGPTQQPPEPPAYEQPPRQPAYEQPAPRPASPPERLQRDVPDEFSGTVLSWSKAEKDLSEGRYQAALDGYKVLLEHSRTRQENQRISDFLALRTAQCLTHLGRSAEAQKMYLQAVSSESPIVRAVGQYRLGLRDVLRGQFMQGRMRGYLGIVALGALDSRVPLETDCDILIARALTNKVFEYYAEKDIMKWGPLRIADPFSSLSESRVRSLLFHGSTSSTEAILGPQIKELESPKGGRRFAVTCARTSIEELLVQFAGRAGVDLKWMFSVPTVRTRPISVRFSDVTDQRFSEVACGAVGLLSKYTEEGIAVYDPQSYKIMSEQKVLLTREAVSAWRRLFLRMPDDPRLAESHFALAVLHELAGELTDAMREYQLIAQRFEGEDLAARGLLRSAALRIRLRDFTGARMDLLGLLDQYPDCADSDKVYLYLGQSTMKVGLLSNAVRVFRKLYYLNLSAESRREACMGAARCFQQMGNFKETNKWATRYIGLVSTPGADLARAYLLVGKSEVAAGRTAEAITAYHHALGSDPDSDTRVEAILELADAQAAEGDFVSAVGALDRIRGIELTQEQVYPYLLKVAGIYRQMGVPEKAAGLLRIRLAAVTDPEMQAQLAVQLAHCHIEENDLEAAMSVLAEFLPKIGPGPTSQAAECLLAEVSLKLGKIAQAIALSTELLKSDCSNQIRIRAQEVLGSAYIARQDYNRATLAYSGLMFNKGGQKE